MTIFRSRAHGAAVLLLLCLVSRSLFAGVFSGAAPDDLGVTGGRLKPCPDKPNCVSSQAEDARYVAPFRFLDSPAAALERIERIVGTMPRMRVVKRTPTYLHAEAASRVFGFIDDIEFLVDIESRLLHVRSAARLGYSDFGVNRRRVETIRAAFAAVAP